MFFQFSVTCYCFGLHAIYDLSLQASWFCFWYLCYLLVKISERSFSALAMLILSSYWSKICMSCLCSLAEYLIMQLGWESIVRIFVTSCDYRKSSHWICWFAKKTGVVDQLMLVYNLFGFPSLSMRCLHVSECIFMCLLRWSLLANMSLKTQGVHCYF